MQGSNGADETRPNNNADVNLITTFTHSVRIDYLSPGVSVVTLSCIKYGSYAHTLV